MARLLTRNRNENKKSNSDYGLYLCLLKLRGIKSTWGPHKIWNPILEIGGFGFPTYTRYLDSGLPKQSE